MQNRKFSRVILALLSLLMCVNMCVGMAMASETADTIPTFVLSFDSEEGVQSFSAFCVRSGENVYLLSSAEAGAVAQTGCDAFLLGVDFSQEAELLKTVGQISYFRADGLEDVTAYELGAEFPDTVVYTTILEENSERYCYVSDPIVMNEGWQDNGSYYLSEKNSVEDTYVLGAAVLTADCSQVVGMLSRNAEHTMVILPLLNNVFPTDATVASVPGTATGADAADATDSQDEESEGNGEAEDGEENPISGKMILIVAGVLLLGGIIVAANRKPSGKKNADSAAVPASGGVPGQGTIPLRSNEMTSELVGMEHTAPVMPRVSSQEAAKWQLRCVRGALEGKAYPLAGKLSIGRAQSNDVVFPENTKGVSGKHCEVLVSGGRVILQDLNSTYGTFYGLENPAKLKPNMDYTLKTGDVFVLAEGGPAFRLEAVGAPEKKAGFAVCSTSGTLYRSNSSGEITFGRSPECVVSFDQGNTAVSGRHCKLIRKEDGLYLMDQGSTNGTFFGESRQLKPNVSYKVAKGTSFYLVNSHNTFVITEE